MKNQELDDMIKRKLNVSSKVPDHLWDQIEMSLNNLSGEEKTESIINKNQKNNWLSVAALIAGLMILGSAIYFNFDNKNIKVDSSNQIKDSKHSTPIAKIKPLDTSFINNNSTLATTISNNTQQTLQYSNQKIVSNNHTVYYQINHKKPEFIHLIENQHELQNLAFQINELAAIESLSKIPLKYSTQEKISVDKIYLPEDFSNEHNLSHNNGNNKHDILLGIAGGFNYGSLKNGGSIAMNTRKQLSDKLFVDGSIGFVMNNSTSSQNNFKGDFIAFKQIRETSQLNKFATQFQNLIESSNPFYFVQVNPSIGMNVAKNIDVSIGPDYQQMISNINYDVVNFADESKLLPRHDFGITGKAELSLNKNLKAGFLMREGFTSLIFNNSNLSDRRYFQIQLKYQLPYSNK